MYLCNCHINTLLLAYSILNICFLCSLSFAWINSMELSMIPPMLLTNPCEHFVGIDLFSKGKAGYWFSYEGNSKQFTDIMEKKSTVLKAGIATTFRWHLKTNCICYLKLRHKHRKNTQSSKKEYTCNSWLPVQSKTIFARSAAIFGVRFFWFQPSCYEKRGRNFLGLLPISAKQYWFQHWTLLKHVCQQIGPNTIATLTIFQPNCFRLKLRPLFWHWSHLNPRLKKNRRMQHQKSCQLPQSCPEFHIFEFDTLRNLHNAMPRKIVSF
jgi:hypothetical protein